MTPFTHFRQLIKELKFLEKKLEKKDIPNTDLAQFIQ